jgi:hypothetical protein
MDMNKFYGSALEQAFEAFAFCAVIAVVVGGTIAMCLERSVLFA